MKRTKLWRQFQQNKKVKKRLKKWANSLDIYIKPNGVEIHNPKWINLLGSTFEHFAQTTSTPCSCGMCSWPKYEREKFKQETYKQLKEVA